MGADLGGEGDDVGSYASGLDEMRRGATAVGAMWCGRTWERGEGGVMDGVHLSGLNKERSEVDEMRKGATVVGELGWG